MEWPPAADDMQLSSEKFLPQKLIRFPNLATAVKEDVVIKYCFLHRTKIYVMQCQKHNRSYLSTFVHVCLSDTCSEVLKLLTTILNMRRHS